jgi:hypothetical protein
VRALVGGVDREKPICRIDRALRSASRKGTFSNRGK